MQSEMHHEILVHNDMPKIDYCVLTVAGNPTMSGGGGKKTQQPLASFFSPTTGPAPASHRPLRTPGSSNRHGYDSDGAMMVLVKSYMHKWGKQGVKGGKHLGWRTVTEWTAKVGV